MADQQPAVAEASRQLDTDSIHTDLISPPSRRDSISSESSIQYQPLPEGHWTVAFHGNCRICRHHHSAALVKIKVTQDEGQINRVKCEKCGATWAAFGGRNATLVSLLSTTSTEPDDMKEEVRLHLIDVVMMATQRAEASLVTLPEQSSISTLEEPDVKVFSHEAPTATKHSSAQLAPALVTEEESLAPSFEQPSQTLPCAVSDGSKGLRQRLAELKRKVTMRFPGLRRNRFRQMISKASTPFRTSKQTEKSDVRTALPERRLEIREEPTADHDVHDHAPQQAHPRPSAPVPVVRFHDVASFIMSLDKSGLETMTDKQQAAWMRRHYTDFKRRPKRRSSLGFSEIFETDIHPHIPAGYWGRRSLEVRAAGTHFEGLDRDEFNGDSPRWSSISISDRLSEAPTAHDDITIASFPRHSPRNPLQRVQGRTQRPLSLPNGTRSLPHLRHRLRSSLPAFFYDGVGSSSTTRGQEPVRFFQGSIAGEFTTGVHDFATTQESLNQPRNMDTPPRNHSASPQLSVSTFRNDTEHVG